MEVNPRLTQSLEVAVLAGVDFPRMQLEWARGGELPAYSGYRAGVRLSWLGGELKLLAGALLGAREAPELAARPLAQGIARDYLEGVRIDGWAFDDPLPSLAHLYGTVVDALRFVWSRAKR
jgi:hypothetical protein